MKKGALFCTVLMLLLGGCTKDIPGINDGPINKDGSIAFRLDSLLTRGTPQSTLTNYDEVALLTYSHTKSYQEGKSLYRDIVLNKEGSAPSYSWDYSPHMFWPDKRGLSFLAYTSDMEYAKASGSDGVFIKGDPAIAAPTIEYVVPQDVKKQPDLLVATLLDHKKVNNVTLAMKHALACVSFCATGPADMRVKSITIKKVFRKATLALDDPTITWVVDPNSKGMTALEPGVKPDQPLNPKPTDNNYLMTADGYLMMIPQALTDAYIDVVYWKGALGTEKTVSHTLPTDVVWEPGKKYIYKFGESGEVVVYYEKYTDGTYGFQSTKTDFAPLDEIKVIQEAGYGVLTKSTSVSAQPTIQIGTSKIVCTSVVPSAGGGYSLYAVNQTGVAGTTTFTLPESTVPVEVYFDGNGVSCGKVIPLFAKGVSDWNLTSHSIRTPQQLRNIGVLTNDNDYNASAGVILTQERNLDFAVQGIGGGTLNGAAVDQTFAGTYNSDVTKSISNLTISAAGATNVGLFARNNGTISNLVIKSANILGGTQVGTLAGQNWFSGVIDKPQVIGIANTPTGRVTVSGISSVGGIVGENSGKVVGSLEMEPSTGITVAEVSGWVDISASDNSVGGVVGNNQSGIVTTTLVNGAYVKSASEQVEAKITIKGGYYVGGLVGVNWRTVNGTITASGNNMPDVAGVVEITGTTAVGGIVGMNAGGSEVNSVNIRTGRTVATKISATGENVGGIVGENLGMLGTGSKTSFISARGNIIISGINNVGGVVGFNNSTTAALENCFVYDYQSRTTSSLYYAPKIEGSGKNVGGIVGNNNGASITGCGVFSGNGATLFISATSGIGAYVGGIAGFNAYGSITTDCSVVGRVQIDAKMENAGGIFGGNGANTITSNCWIGSRDGKSLLANAVKNLGLYISPAPTPTTVYATPYVTGGNNIGGIVGLNGGIIQDITLSDNVTVGRPDGDPGVGQGSNFVGGIVGGNSAGDGSSFGVVKNCKVENIAGRTVTIQGSLSVGGIVGNNNGTIDGCSVSGVSGAPLRLVALGTLGGIVGQNGGNAAITPGLWGNIFTVIKNCKVTGYVTIQGSAGTWDGATQVGGIAGLNGPNEDTVNNIDQCVVAGAAAGSITISVGGYAVNKKGTIGGIVGTNSGYLKSCDVRNANITSAQYYAGGIAGQTIANGTSFVPTTNYRSNLIDCRVYPNVVITGYSTAPVAPGALVGYLDTTVAIAFGNTTTPNLVSNTGVTVNGSQPIQGNRIVGYVTGGSTMQHTVQGVPARP